MLTSVSMFPDFYIYFLVCDHFHRALDAYNKCLNLAPPVWGERATALGNRAAVLVMLLRYWASFFMFFLCGPQLFRVYCVQEMY